MYVLWTKCLCACNIYMLKPYPSNVIVLGGPLRGY